MAGLSWFPVDANLRSHRKTLRLAAALGDPRAHSWLVDLWGWAYRSATNGTITGSDAGLIVEMAVGWTGEPGRLAKAFVSSGWMDQVEDGLRIHDWDQHAGPLMAKAERDAERARDRRTKVAGKFAPSRGRSADVAQTSRGRPGDVAGNSNRNPNPNPLLSEEKTSAPPTPFLPDADPGKPNTQAQQLSLVGGTEPVSSATPEALRDLWNALKAPEQPAWDEIPPKRRTQAQARLTERPLRGPNGWDEVFRRLATSSFARGIKPGSGGKFWIAGPKFFLQPDAATKVLEGTYADWDAPPRREEPQEAPCAVRGCVFPVRGALPGAGDLCSSHWLGWQDSQECTDAPRLGFPEQAARWLERTNTDTKGAAA